ncbi:Reverse transcriptase domain [Arabidopsis suecica]|uniref:Reverse transcriptase domain n=1 Tax=Arabidopsis suecica TaxID=45249 RepID=A0A8T1YPV8_ARASU|nr:Reverse transcriptase domain [Arabidopsis suecica]
MVSQQVFFKPTGTQLEIKSSLRFSLFSPQLVLERLGCHEQWVNWIMQCIITVSYSFLLNGNAKGLVIPERGIRQGDPLSPYIFILCGEVLSGLCNKAQQSSKLEGIRVSKNSPRVNHLLFANDTMFFCRSDPQSCQELKSILHKYESASGQKINSQKSAITFSKKTTAAIKERVKRDLQIPTEGGKGKYLGLPELFGRKKKDLFTSIIDKIKQRALSWSSRFLSTAGKMIMLKSVISAMPSYTMTCFKIPTSLCKRIQSALTRFWWDANTEKKKMAWISWKKMTKSVKTGGLGFRDLQKFNDALLAKISWRIINNPTCLLSRVLLGKYCHTSHFLDTPAPNSASHGWKSICIGRDLLKPHIVTPVAPATEKNQSMMVSQLRLSETLEWNKELIQQILPAYEQEILLLQPSKKGGMDTWAWLPSSSGTYTVKSGYYEALNAEEQDQTLSLPPDNYDWKSNLWRTKCSPKLKLLMWKAMQNALPVGENLKSRTILESARCIHCEAEEESVVHLFFTCEFAKEVWDLVPCRNSLNLSQISSFRSGFEASKLLTCLPPIGIVEGPLSPWILWSLWSTRNNKIFKDRHLQPLEVVTQAILQAKEWSLAQERKNPLRLPGIPRTLTLVDPRSVRCNTDAAWKDHHRSGFGWIFSDHQGSTLHQGTGSADKVNSPLQAEALALLFAMQQARTLGFNRISFASDSTQLVKAINSELQFKELHGILFDILDLSALFDCISFCFIPRTENTLADSLAKQALSSLCNGPGPV